ncbi:hypothetical protein V2J09_002258 [Rumex salicifolius]
MVTAGYFHLVGLLKRPILNTPYGPYWSHLTFSYLLLRHHNAELRRFSTASSEWDSPPELSGESAYDILGIPETSSFDEVKLSFRKLAKETHPDLASSEDSEASKRFLQIVAAYEILSDPNKRAVYDEYLLAQRSVELNYVRRVSSSGYHMYATYANTTKEMEVVEWLRWYRQAVKDILSEKKAIGGSGYFDVLQKDFYSAIHAAYYGPDVEPIDLLPDRFEAEERSTDDTPDVLHLVSGRDLFGVIRISDKAPELSGADYRNLLYGESLSSDSCSLVDELGMNRDRGIGQKDVQIGLNDMEHNTPDAYKNLELHIFGQLVATATRVPPGSSSSEMQNEESEDKIYVCLGSCEERLHLRKGFCQDDSSNGDVSSDLLGRVIGLGNDAEESSCSVYDRRGKKTHMILKHRTLLVKHMHWFQIRDEVSVCECRCTRARLPPSKFWLFEPRCSMHDIGGWYVETYGLDKKRRNVPSQRHWNGFEAALHPEK